MAKYKFKQNYLANGANIVPSGSNISPVRLQKNFSQGEVIDGVLKTFNINVQCVKAPCPPFKSETLSIITDGANIVPLPNAKYSSLAYTGKAIFNIPLSVLEEVKSETAQKASDPKTIGDNLKLFGAVAGVAVSAGVGYAIAKKMEWNLLLGTLVGGGIIAGGLILYNRR